ncbi:MAG: DUF72 domain-containing protein [Bdellovibrionales bacterium]|nr:DUF72 domain-containing protein [Bdellovibrionales bacterium]
MKGSYTFDFEAIEKLSSHIRFGGSSWTYPGWKGLIYKREYRSDKNFTQNAFEEYAHFPLFRTVGIDRFFYTPPSVQLLKDYDEKSPDGFLWVSKVWERITIPRFPKHPRYGSHAGLDNPYFLNPNLFGEEVLGPYEEANVLNKTGPFVFQFPWISPNLLSSSEFLAKLSEFLHKIPTSFRYAIEVRNAEYLSPPYFQILNEANATHCFNHWNSMPPLHEQMKRAVDGGSLQAPFYVARILTPLGITYQEAVKKFEPYEEIRQANPVMRRDVVRLIKRAFSRQVMAFVIVNNRSEGNSPMTIDAISRMAVKALGL